MQIRAGRVTGSVSGHSQHSHVLILQHQQHGYLQLHVPFAEQVITESFGFIVSFSLCLPGFYKEFCSVYPRALGKQCSLQICLQGEIGHDDVMGTSMGMEPHSVWGTGAEGCCCRAGPSQQDNRLGSRGLPLVLRCRALDLNRHGAEGTPQNLMLRFCACLACTVGGASVLGGT